MSGSTALSTQAPGRICTYCGNKYLESGEACDDGNIGAGDGCSAIC